MTIREWANSVEQQYAKRIARLTGGEVPGNIRFAFNDAAGDIASANAAGNVINLNRSWFRENKGQRTGAIVHELAHIIDPKAYNPTGAAEWGDIRGEQRADALRLALTGRDGGWTPSAEARSIANERGWMDMGLPGTADTTKPGGRARNTFANLLSHNKVDYTNKGGQAALPALSPAQTQNYYAGLAGLYSQYQNQLAALKQARIGARAQFRTEAAGIAAERRAGAMDVESDALERGIVGSSVQAVGMVENEAAAAAAKQAALTQKRTTLADTRLAANEAGTAYYQGVTGLQGQALATQQEALANQLANNLIISGQESTMDILKQIYEAYAPDGGGGGGGGNGGGGSGTPNAPGISARPQWWRDQIQGGGSEQSFQDRVRQWFQEQFAGYDPEEVARLIRLSGKMR